MKDFTPFYRTGAGTRLYWRDDEGGGATVASVQDVAPILELNKQMATHNDGWSRDRDRLFRRVASIPVAVQLKWLTEEGWDCLSADPGCQARLRRKLNSSEYLYLRTAHFQL